MMTTENSCGQKIEDFADDVNIADLCDCGRHKRLGQSTRLFGRKRGGPVPLSDYQATFQAVENPRPRSSKRPPPTPPRATMGLPMLFDTNQRIAYTTPKNRQRVYPILQEDQYQKATVPLDGMTSYQSEYVPKPLEPAFRSYPQKDRLKMSRAKFEGTTTNQQHFKQWIPQPNLAYGELPSFAGSILFPEKGKLPESTARNSFIGEFSPPAVAVKPGITNIKMEGNMTFDTTNSQTFKNIQGNHQVQPITNKPDLPIYKRGPFNGETQSNRDFPGFLHGQPLPPRPAEPAPSTIDLKFNNRTMFATEQRSTYKGHDVMKHPMVASCKKEDETYVPSAMALESETSQKRDYRPHDVTVNPVAKACQPPTQLHQSEVKFASNTTNQDLFKDWGVKPRVRYGDIHENNLHVDSRDKFTAESVTMTSYVTKSMERVRSYKPNQNKTLDKHPPTNYLTSYSETFVPKQVPMCKAEEFLLQRELRQRLNKSENREMTNSLVFAK